MKRTIRPFAISMLPFIFLTCRKENTSTDACAGHGATVRKISNQAATIKLTATHFPVWIIEDGTIDAKLIPCNFPMEFYQDDLKVTISGDVKSSASGPLDPCCMEYFVITSISR